jgi:malate dehydrogenase
VNPGSQPVVTPAARILAILRSVAILGSGDLAATLARRLAEAQAARRIVLVDEDTGRARGKALDIAQAGPVEHFDARLVGAADLLAAGPADAVVVADPADLPDGTARPSEAFVERLRTAAAGLIVVASAHPCALVESLVRAGRPRERVLGSSPVAHAAALRRRLAEALEVEAREVTATVLGVPPHALLAPQASACAGGAPVTAWRPAALRQAVGALAARTPGPVALATAAARVLQALAGSRPSLLPVAAWLDGEYGHRGLALAVPARLCAGRLEGVVEVPLEPVERVALDTLAERRLARQA